MKMIQTIESMIQCLSLERENKYFLKGLYSLRSMDIDQKGVQPYITLLLYSIVFIFYESIGLHQVKMVFS